MPVILRDCDTHLAVSGINTTGQIDHIPAHVYTLTTDPFGTLILVKDRKRFKVPEKKYGKHTRYFNILTKRYDRLNPTLGVLLVGKKGSGKSLLAEDVGNWGLNQDIPVLLVNEPIHPNLIHSALSVIGPCIIYFDEFGKVYSDEDKRNMMLAFFSDSSHTGVLNIVTGNGVDEISEYMMNRPGRFEFRFNFQRTLALAFMDIARDFHLSGEIESLFLRTMIHREATMDIALKLAPYLRDCKTLDEALDMFDILNVPEPVYVYHRIREAVWKGKQVKTQVFRCSSEDDELTTEIFLPETKEFKKWQFHSLNHPNATRMRNYGYNYEGSQKDEQYEQERLNLGEYRIELDDDLIITYTREFGGARNVIGDSLPRSLPEEEKADADNKSAAESGSTGAEVSSGVSESLGLGTNRIGLLNLGGAAGSAENVAAVESNPPEITASVDLVTSAKHLSSASGLLSSIHDTSVRLANQAKEAGLGGEAPDVDPM
jgi:hypothetical protein